MWRGSIPDAVAIAVLGALLYFGKVSESVAVSTILAVLAGRLYPRSLAAGQSTANESDGPPGGTLARASSGASGSLAASTSASSSARVAEPDPSGLLTLAMVVPTLVKMGVKWLHSYEPPPPGGGSSLRPKSGGYRGSLPSIPT